MSVNQANSENIPPIPYPAGHPSQRDAHCYQRNMNNHQNCLTKKIKIYRYSLTYQFTMHAVKSTMWKNVRQA